MAGCTNDPDEGDAQGNNSPEDEGDRPADEDESEDGLEDKGGEAEETTLRVTVKTEDGDLVEGATVAIEGEEIEGERETEADGTALFDNIEPGSYAVEATADRYGTATAGVDLEGGENEEIEMTLPAEQGEEEQESEAGDGT